MELCILELKLRQILRYILKLDLPSSQICITAPIFAPLIVQMASQNQMTPQFRVALKHAIIWVPLPVEHELFTQAHQISANLNRNFLQIEGIVISPQWWWSCQIHSQCDACSTLIFFSLWSTCLNLPAYFYETDIRPNLMQSLKTQAMMETYIPLVDLQVYHQPIYAHETHVTCVSRPAWSRI